jgi:hypothetical protein
MIISAGYNIAAVEVEDALLRHEAVAECAVIGHADEERGRIVKAFVVLRAPHRGDEAMVKALQDFVKATVAPDKYPRAVESGGVAEDRDGEAAEVSAADEIDSAVGFSALKPDTDRPCRIPVPAAGCSFPVRRRAQAACRGVAAHRAAHACPARGAVYQNVRQRLGNSRLRCVNALRTFTRSLAVTVRSGPFAVWQEKFAASLMLPEPL